MEQLPPHIRTKIQVCEKRGCWEWQGEKDSYGYGRAWFKGARYQAHRLMYWLLDRARGNFKIDNRNQELDHLCENRSCVNPAHMEVVTRKKNMSRIKRRRKRIDENGNLVGGKLK